MPSLVDVDAMHFRYGRQPSRESDTWTLRDVTLTIEADSTLGVVGESGSGKSTLIRVLCGLLRHQQGRVDFDGRPIADWLVKSPKELRRRNQIVFQSPRRSLDPRMRIRRTLRGTRPLAGATHAVRRRARRWAGARRPRRRGAVAVPPPAVGWAAPTCRDRQSVVRAARRAVRRRARQRPRCVGAGAGAQPADGRARRARAGAGDGLARPRRRQPLVRTDHRPPRRGDRGCRPDVGGLRRSAGRLHRSRSSRPRARRA